LDKNDSRQGFGLFAEEEPGRQNWQARRAAVSWGRAAARATGGRFYKLAEITNDCLFIISRKDRMVCRHSDRNNIDSIPNSWYTQ